MSFDERLQKQSFLRNEFLELLKKSKIHFIEKETKFILRIGIDTYFCVVRNSEAIERKVYESLLLKDSLIFLKKYNSFIFCKVKDLKFKIPYANDVPVTDKFWLSPRKLSKEKYNAWQRTNIGSGTEFAYIDKKNFRNFEELIQPRLL